VAGSRGCARGGAQRTNTTCCCTQQQCVARSADPICSLPPPRTQQILDKEEYTLEELLDEDDIIQECKSLNGRLIAL